jgi:hypothetical protein
MDLMNIHQLKQSPKVESQKKPCSLFGGRNAPDWVDVVFWRDSDVANCDVELTVQLEAHRLLCLKIFADESSVFNWLCATLGYPVDSLRFRADGNDYIVVAKPSHDVIQGIQSLPARLIYNTLLGYVYFKPSELVTFPRHEPAHLPASWSFANLVNAGVTLRTPVSEYRVKP